MELVAVRERHVELEEEAVELRLGQRVGALHLERVLRREHEERLLERVRRAWPTVTRCSCIASSSALCVFGVARLISSARTMFAKIGPLRNSKTLLAAARLVDHRRADDVGRHQVGRELDAREVRAPSASASVRTSIVLPSPGTPSSSAWPPASMQVSTPSTTLAVADDRSCRSPRAASPIVFWNSHDLALRARLFRLLGASLSLGRSSRRWVGMRAPRYSRGRISWK